MTTTKKKAKRSTQKNQTEAELLRVEIARIRGQRDEARQNHISAMAALERLAGSTEAADSLAAGVDRMDQAQRPSEEARLRDAVVEAALAWFSAGEDLGPGQKQESMMTAIVALRAHRAKKGGA